MGRKISNRHFEIVFQTFRANIFTRTSLEGYKLILTFSRNQSPCNSIFLHFCMFYAPFNISATLEASELKFSHNMHR